MTVFRAEPCGDEDDLPGASELDDDTRGLAGETPPLDDVFALSIVLFALDRDDPAGEDDICGVVEAEAVLRIPAWSEKAEALPSLHTSTLFDRPTSTALQAVRVRYDELGSATPFITSRGRRLQWIG